MAVSSWINQNIGVFIACFLNPADQIAFVIGLAKIDIKIELFSLTLAARFDIIERCHTVYARLTLPKKIEIGAVQNKNCFHHIRP
ncbi:hypothetical protein D9M69_709870 [compost metagenome]